MADDIRPPAAGDASKFARAAEEIKAKAEAAAARAAELETALAEGRVSMDEFLKAVEREQAAERAATEKTGQRTRATRAATQAQRAESGASRESTRATEQKAAADRQAAEAASQRARAEQQGAGRAGGARRVLREQADAARQAAVEQQKLVREQQTAVNRAEGQAKAARTRVGKAEFAAQYAPAAEREQKQAALARAQQGVVRADQKVVTERAALDTLIAKQRELTDAAVTTNKAYRDARRESQPAATATTTQVDGERKKTAVAKEESAKRVQTARQEATQVEAATRKEAEAGRRPGTALIPHPGRTESGARVFGQPFYGQADPIRPPAIDRPHGLADRIAPPPRPPSARIEPVGVAGVAAQQARAQAAASALETQEAERSAAAQKRSAAVREEAARASLNLAAAEGRTSTTFREGAVAVDLSSQAWRKHGALTTEFIAAAARGEASYREWGYQIGATAGKFAGWTAVSIPIFAAADAIRRIGQGAIASSSGVGQLQRVVQNVKPSQATSDFRDLAEHFNVPIDTASDAVFRMGQVFHNQKDAVTAARAALYAYQTGGVDVEKSTKSLTAIQQGFGFSAGQLVGVFDQLNAAQNQYGISLEDSMSGIARAAGSFKSAGGDVDYLLSLITTAKRVTGASGQELGNTFARSAGFIRRPKNQQELRDFGIDPTQDIDQVYEQAFTAARGLKGPARLQLATALSSPQLARNIVPILQNEDLFRQVQQKTSPGASKGASEKELNSVLDQISSKIQKVGVEFELLGSNLAESGLLNVFGGLVEGLNGVLGLTNHLLENFNALPGPLKTTLATMLELRIAVGAMRRFHLFDQADGGLFAESPQKRERRLIGSGVRASAKASREDLERDAGGLRTAVTRRDKASEKLRVLEAAPPGGDLDAHTVRLTKAREQLAREADRVGDAETAYEAALARATKEHNLEAQFVQGTRRRGFDAPQFARENEIYVPPELDRPSTRGPLTIDQFARKANLPRVDTGPRTPADAREGAPRSGGASERSRDVVAHITKLEGEAAARAAQEARQQAARFGRAGTVVAATWGQIAQATRAAGSGISRAAGAIAGAFGGPIGLAVSALILFLPEIIDKIGRANDRAEELDKVLNDPPRTRRQYERQGRAAERLVEGYNRARRDPSDPEALRYLEVQRRRPSVLPERPGSGLARFFQDQLQESFPVGPDPNEQVSRSLRIQAGRRVRERRIANSEKTKSVFRRLYGSDITDMVKQDLKDLHAGRLTPEEFQQEMGRRIKELQVSPLISVGNKIRGRQNIRNIMLREARGTKTYLQKLLSDGLNTSSDELVKAQVESMTGLLETPRATPGVRRRIGAATAVRAARARLTGGPKGQTQYAEALQQYGQIGDIAGQTLQQDLQLARTEGQRDAAWKRFLGAIRAGGAGARLVLAHLQANLVEAEAELRRQEAIAAAAPGGKGPNRLGAYGGLFGQGGGLGGNPFGGFNRPKGNVAGARGAVTGAKRQRDAVKKVLDDLKKDDAERVRIAADQRKQDAEQRAQQAKQDAEQAKQAREQQQQERFQLAGTRIQLHAARLPVRSRAAYLVRGAGQQVQRAIRIWGRSSQEAMQAMMEQLSAQDSAVQEQAALIQAQTGLAIAKARGSAAEARAQMGGLRRLLGFYRSHPRQFGPADIVGVEEQIASAQKQRAEQAKQDAEQAKAKREEANQKARDLISARYEYLESLTDDPVKIANLEARRASAIVGRGGFSTQADRLRALAERNKTRREAQRTKYESRLGDIEFNASIGKISEDQQLTFLKGLEKVTRKFKDLNRNIRKQIYDLQHSMDGDLELNVGDLRLPTLYETRRFLGESRGNGTSTVVNQGTVHVNVARREDVGLVGEALEGFQSGTGAALGRAAGVS